jgi:hypothetical protein
MEIVQLLGDMLVKEVEDGELMYLVERLCLPTSMDVALALFEIANNEALLVFTNEVKVRKIRPTEEATVMVSGSESSPLTLVDTAPPIDEELRRGRAWGERTRLQLVHTLATRGLPWRQNGGGNEDQSEESVDAETAVRPRP